MARQWSNGRLVVSQNPTGYSFRVGKEVAVIRRRTLSDFIDWLELTEMDSAKELYSQGAGNKDMQAEVVQPGVPDGTSEDSVSQS